MIKLHVKLADGKDTTIEISELKPTVYIYDMITKLAGRPLDKLEKNGNDKKEIPRQKTMIKDVLKNGDTIKEISSTVHPRSKFQHAVDPKQIKEGLVKREDVLEITVSFNTEKKTLLVYKGTTIDELKKIVNAIPIFKEIVKVLKRDSVGELVYAKDKKAVYLGWEGDMKRETSVWTKYYTNEYPELLKETPIVPRTYDGSQTLESFNIQDGTIFYCNELPFTQEDLLWSSIEKRKREEIFKKRREERNRRWKEEFVPAFQKTGYFSSQQTPPPPQQTPPPPSQETPPSEHKQTCEELLRTEGIVDKPTYLKWALANHPDKFPDASPEEKEKIKEKIQIINNCVDILEIKNIKGVKKGGRRTRKNKTKKSKTRKHKSTRK